MRVLAVLFAVLLLPSALEGSVVAASFAQTTVTADADPAAPSLAGNPTANNCLLAVGQERVGQSDVANYTITNSLTAIGGQATLPADINSRRSFRVWAKAAAGTEQSVSIDDGTANAKRGTYAEIANSLGLTSYALVDSDEVDTGTGSDGTTGLTATTGSIAAGKYLLLAVATWRKDSGALADIAWDFTPDVTFNTTLEGSNTRVTALAVKEVAGGTAYSAKVTWTGAGHEGNLGLYVVGVAAAAPAAGKPYHYYAQQRSA